MVAAAANNLAAAISTHGGLATPAEADVAYGSLLVVGVDETSPRLWTEVTARSDCVGHLDDI
jgi:hypothetical protein